MKRSAMVTAAMLLAAPAFTFAPARAEGPLCFGLPATVADRSGEIVGTPGDDVIIGDNGRNVIYTEGGSDAVCGLGGDDDLEVTGDEPSLRVDGGDGDDELYAYMDGPLEVNGGPGDDYIAGGRGSNTTFRGGPGDDVLSSSGWVGDENYAMFGDDGDDTLYGYGADEVLDGGAGADEIYGDGGFDTIDGGTSTHPETEKVRKGKKKNGKPKYVKRTVHVEDSDLCQIGSGGGTATNCEREV